MTATAPSIRPSPSLSIHDVSRVERESIREFVLAAAAGARLLSGRVLDYGCGAQPYAEIVTAAGGDYHPWDRKALVGGSVGDYGPADPLNVIDGPDWDAILCTQVVEYVPDVYRLLRDFRDALGPTQGHLVMTYPTVWRELPGDLHRFTHEGMERLLKNTGFTVLRHEKRATIRFADFDLPLGYEVVARA